MDEETSQEKVMSPGTYILADIDNGGIVREVHVGEEKEIIPIKQDYIPVMDKITLKSANGNLYDLTIDSSGQLAINQTQ
jgi:hypothetical protein